MSSTMMAPTMEPSMWAASVRKVRDRWVGGLALEGVLDLLASLLEVALGLVGLALGLQLLVVGHAAGGLLGLSFEFFGLVLGLVVKPHRCLLGCRLILVLCSRAAATETGQPFRRAKRAAWCRPTRGGRQRPRSSP